MWDEEERAVKRLCANPRCIFKFVIEDDIHPSGLCAVCCPTSNDMSCPICWYDKDLDD